MEERFDYDGLLEVNSDLRKQLSDAQATVEALQADKLMLERGVSAQSALIDGLQSQLIQCTADLEALQRERDEANSHVKFLGATKQANGSFCLDMKKYHAGHRCGRHRDDPWQGIDTEIDCFVCLKQALDAEREKLVAVAKERDVQCTLKQNCIGMLEQEREKVRDSETAYRKLSEQWNATDLQLTQLQALVRAADELYTNYGVIANPNYKGPIHIGEWIGKVRVTLDATTPAAKGGDDE